MNRLKAKMEGKLDRRRKEVFQKSLASSFWEVQLSRQLKMKMHQIVVGLEGLLLTYPKKKSGSFVSRKISQI
jgi:hypothetical protein